MFIPTTPPAMRSVTARWRSSRAASIVARCASRSPTRCVPGWSACRTAGAMRTARRGRRWPAATLGCPSTTGSTTRSSSRSSASRSSTACRCVSRRRVLRPDLRTPHCSEKLLQSVGRFLGPFLQHPVSGVLQHGDGHIRGDKFRLLTEYSSEGLLAADDEERHRQLRLREFGDLPPFPHPVQLGRLRIGQPSSRETHPPMTQDDPNVIQPGRDPTTFTAVAISPGVGMGPAWLVVDLLKSAPDPAAIARDQIAGEWSRILTSFEQTRRELEDSALRIEEQFDATLAGIFRAHGMMLDGILSSGEIKRELGSLVGAEAAVLRVFRRLHERFMTLKGPTLQQRADDVADLGRRVLRHLRGVDGSSLDVPAGHVLVVERLLPSDVVPLSRRGVAAIVVGALAAGAHAALLAREKRIPVV